MIRLNDALRAWGTPAFEATLKREVAELDIGQLPLQQALSIGSHVVAAPVTVTLHRIVETESAIRVKAGIFYQSVIAGCSCRDDPTPTSENDEYCEVWLDIDKGTADTTISLVKEQDS